MTASTLKLQQTYKLHFAPDIDRESFAEFPEEAGLAEGAVWKLEQGLYRNRKAPLWRQHLEAVSECHELLSTPDTPNPSQKQYDGRTYFPHVDGGLLHGPSGGSAADRKCIVQARS